MEPPRPLLRFYVQDVEEHPDRIVFTVVDSEGIGRTETVERLHRIPADSRPIDDSRIRWRCTCPASATLRQHANRVCWHITRAMVYYHEVEEMKRKAKELANFNREKKGDKPPAPMFSTEAKRKIKLTGE